MLGGKKDQSLHIFNMPMMSIDQDSSNMIVGPENELSVNNAKLEDNPAFQSSVENSDAIVDSSRSKLASKRNVLNHSSAEAIPVSFRPQTNEHQTRNQSQDLGVNP